MTLFQAVFLGLIQGLTEFFPISSSAHLALAKKMLGISQEGVYFDLFTHVGTLLALTIYLRKDLKEALLERKKFLQVTLALLPLIPVYFLLKPVRDFVSTDLFLGLFLMLTALLLFNATKERVKKPSWMRASLFIGMMQASALVPGISRSASTIWAGKKSGFSSKEAVRFSFLLSIPAVFGGLFLETLKAIKTSAAPLITPEILAASFTSLITAFAVIHFAFKVLEKGSFRPFAWYCLTLGVVVSLNYLL